MPYTLNRNYDHNSEIDNYLVRLYINHMVLLALGLALYFLFLKYFFVCIFFIENIDVKLNKISWLIHRV